MMNEGESAAMPATGKTPNCPACSKPLMSRVAKLCSWCSAPVPETLRFTPGEIAAIHAGEAAAKKKLGSIEHARAVQDGKQAVQNLAGEAAGASIVAAIVKNTL